MTQNWIKATKLESIPENEVIGLSVEGVNLAFYRYEGEIYVTDNVCTHGQAMLSDGWFEDGEIECPLHQGRFCIKSGKALCAPLSKDIKTYPVRINQDDVEVQIG